MNLRRPTDSRSRRWRQWRAPFIGTWNAFLWPLLIAQDPGMRTVQVALSQLMTSQGIRYPEMFMGALVAVAPALVVFGVLQRWLVQGVTLLSWSRAWTAGGSHEFPGLTRASRRSCPSAPPTRAHRTRHGWTPAATAHDDPCLLGARA